MRILRLVTSKSVEEHILARAQYKLDLDGKVIQAGKFDNKTSDAEREELLRSLFGEKEEEEDGAKEVDDEDIAMNDEELNEIISRNEEELDVFRRIDEERESRDILDWQGLGKNGPWNKSRLMIEEELPAVYLVDVAEALEQEKQDNEAVIFGRGNRERKDVQYDDVMSEEQWLNAVDRGEDPDALSRLKRASRGRASAVDDDTGKRGATGGSRKKRKGPHGIDLDAADTVDPSMRQAMIRIFTNVYNAVEGMTVSYDGYVDIPFQLILS